eukprot:768812-Hanusia_phi.AAC.7
MKFLHPHPRARGVLLSLVLSDDVVGADPLAGDAKHAEQLQHEGVEGAVVGRDKQGRGGGNPRKSETGTGHGIHQPVIEPARCQSKERELATRHPGPKASERRRVSGSLGVELLARGQRRSMTAGSWQAPAPPAVPSGWWQTCIRHILDDSSYALVKFGMTL